MSSPLGAEWAPYDTCDLEADCRIVCLLAICFLSVAYCCVLCLKTVPSLWPVFHRLNFVGEGRAQAAHFGGHLLPSSPTGHTGSPGCPVSWVCSQPQSRGVNWPWVGRGWTTAVSCLLPCVRV